MFKPQNTTAPEGAKITTIDFGGYLRVHAAGCHDVNKDFDRYVKENNWKPPCAHAEFQRSFREEYSPDKY